jgi:hypothetical protein
VIATKGTKNTKGTERKRVFLKSFFVPSVAFVPFVVKSQGKVIGD